MKINNKLKVFLSGIGIVSVIGITVVTMMYPELIDYPYSYESIRIKHDTLESNTNNISSTMSAIPQKKEELERRQQQVSELIRENEEMKRKFDFGDLEYHLPSLLITLEQGAIDAGIKEEYFFIEFDKIKTNVSDSSGGGGAPAGRPDRNPSERPNRDPGNSNDEGMMDNPGDIESEQPARPENTRPEPGATPENSDSTNPDSQEIDHTLPDGDIASVLAMDVTPVIPGISVTTIPIKATDLTYGQANAYLSFLDNLDFVEPSFVDIYSEGDKLSLITLIHVFHEGGASNGQE